MAETAEDATQDYQDDQDDLYSDPIGGKKERKEEAMMDAASKKRSSHKKEGPSNRVPKKMGQKERRLESEALAEDGRLRVEEEDFESDVDVDLQEKRDHDSDPAVHSDGDVSTSGEYDIISKDEIPDDLRAHDSGRESRGSRKSRGSSKSRDSKEKSRDHKEHREHKEHKSSKEHKKDKESKKSSGHKKLHKHEKHGYGGYKSSEPRNSSKGGVPPSPSKPKKRRFKKSELGPYANEKRMPEWLRDALLIGGREILTKQIAPDGSLILRRSYSNETWGLIPVLRQLLQVDPTVAKAYLCHPSVKHVFKEHPAANGFCGYRNIQMMASYCQKVQVYGCGRLYGRRVPSIIEIQEWIEAAWDMGINSHGRAETGGVLYTRKYIGSSEVEAMFTSFGAKTIPHQFSEPNQQISALRHVWDYFSDEFDHPEKVVQTDKPPIYFQHHGHSMTIVGIERYKDGSMSFLCFDPMFSPSQAIRGLVGQNRLRSNIAYGKLLKPFRRGGSYLKRFTIFEMVE
ncbi:hypothetical protein ABW19_dt0203476 [Dactylella cylindrospora]|nr:hypothetical protein ABW19_dt0203476 [Dactylella cylindrospora]